MNELSFWDYVTLGVTLIVITAWFVLRIMRAFDSKNSGGCSGCSKGVCPPTNGSEGSTNCGDAEQQSHERTHQ